MLDDKGFTETQLQYLSFWSKIALPKLEVRGWSFTTDAEPHRTLEEALKKAVTLTRQGKSKNDIHDGLVVFLLIVKKAELKLNLPAKERFIPLEIWPDDLEPV